MSFFVNFSDSKQMNLKVLDFGYQFVGLFLTHLSGEISILFPVRGQKGQIIPKSIIFFKNEIYTTELIIISRFVS